MKCITTVESKTWLASIGVGVLGDLDSNTHNLPMEAQVKADESRQEIFCCVPASAGSAEAFSAVILEWFPQGGERLYLLTHWQTYPDRMVPLFESLRRGFGGYGSISETPGALFRDSGNAGVEDQRKPPELDRVALSGMVFLTLCYTWEGYLFSTTCRDFIFLGDGFIRFSSVASARIDEAKSLMNMFELEPLTSSPWS